MSGKLVTKIESPLSELLRGGGNALIGAAGAIPTVHAAHGVVNTPVEYVLGLLAAAGAIGAEKIVWFGIKHLKENRKETYQLVPDSQ